MTQPLLYYKITIRILRAETERIRILPPQVIFRIDFQSPLPEGGYEGRHALSKTQPSWDAAPKQPFKKVSVIGQV